MWSSLRPCLLAPFAKLLPTLNTTPLLEILQPPRMGSHWVKRKWLTFARYANLRNCLTYKQDGYTACSVYYDPAHSFQEPKKSESS